MAPLSVRVRGGDPRTLAPLRRDLRARGPPAFPPALAMASRGCVFRPRRNRRPWMGLARDENLLRDAELAHPGGNRRTVAARRASPGCRRDPGEPREHPSIRRGNGPLADQAHHPRGRDSVRGGALRLQPGTALFGVPDVAPSLRLGRSSHDLRVRRRFARLAPSGKLRRLSLPGVSLQLAHAPGGGGLPPGRRRPRGAHRRRRRPPERAGNRLRGARRHRRSGADAAFNRAPAKGQGVRQPASEAPDARLPPDLGRVHETNQPDRRHRPALDGDLQHRLGDLRLLLRDPLAGEGGRAEARRRRLVRALRGGSGGDPEGLRRGSGLARGDGDRSSASLWTCRRRDSRMRRGIWRGSFKLPTASRSSETRTSPSDISRSTSGSPGGPTPSKTSPF